MLVDCPKCGFSQPQDQYCAKCGIDMQSYRPKPEPVQSRLLSNPIFHVSIAFILVFASSLYIINQQRQNEKDRRVEYLKYGPLYAETTKQPAPPPSSADPETQESASLSARTAGAPPPTTAEVGGSAPASAPPPPSTTAASEISAEMNLASTGSPIENEDSAATTDTTTKVRAVSLKAHYALVGRTRLASLIENSRSQSQFVDFGEFQMGSLRNLKNYMDGMDLMETASRKFVNANAEQTWFVGERVGDGTLGIETKVVLRGFENGILRGEIEILRRLHESADLSQGIQVKPYGPHEFELAPNSGLVIVLSLPRVAQYDEQNFVPTQFLRIFRMNDFKQKQSEFVMLLDFE